MMIIIIYYYSHPIGHNMALMRISLMASGTEQMLKTQ